MNLTRLPLDDRQTFELIDRSELATAPLDSTRTPIEGGYVEATRSRPDYRRGNRIVLDTAPKPDEYPRWIQTYRELFAWRTEAAPAIVAWRERYVPDADDKSDERVKRTTGMLAPLTPSEPPRPAGLQSATVDSGELWDGFAALSERVDPEPNGFNRWRVSTLRELQQREFGRIRVLLDPAGKPIGAVGAFARNGVARFSGVITDVAYRNRGCASYLIAATLRDQRDLSGRIVICAAAHSAAERLYLQLGFRPFVTIRSLEVA